MITGKWPEALPRANNQRLTQVKSQSPWFEIYQVNADTFALLEPCHFEEVISFLVIGNERAALIDTGMGIGNIQIEVERLTNLPIIVVNTHTHLDHVGDNHRFSEVWVFDETTEIARLERGYTRAECTQIMEPETYFDLPPDFDLTTYEIKPSQVTRRLTHLSTIDLGQRTLTVHHTPGHSPGSICLLDSRDRILFTGDTYYPSTLVAHLPGSDFDAYRRSIQYLVSLLDQVSFLCTSHNEICAEKDNLIQVQTAIEQIVNEQVDFERLDDTVVYRFEGFAIKRLQP